MTARSTPDQLIAANEQPQIQVVVKRPGWIAWLAGEARS